MKVFVFPGARKQLKKLPKIFQILITQRLTKLSSSISSNTKKLTNYKNVYRTRVGHYRIIFEVSDEKIYVILIGHRKEIYKLLDMFMK